MRSRLESDPGHLVFVDTVAAHAVNLLAVKAWLEAMFVGYFVLKVFHGLAEELKNL